MQHSPLKSSCLVFGEPATRVSSVHRFLPRLFLSFFIAVLFVGAGCRLVGGKLFHRSDEVVTASGLRYTDLKVGDGPRPRIGQTIRVNYVGWLEDGREIDNSSKRAGPAQFVLGPALIAGWNEALQTMRVGGKRRLIIPPNLAYGASGVPPNIPPNATLTFEVELLDVR